MSPFASLRPIFSALRRHKAAVTLLVLEIALTMAVLGNLLFIVHGSAVLQRESTGVPANDVAVIQSMVIGDAKHANTVKNNLAVLRTVPGVLASSFGATPMLGASWNPIYSNASRTRMVAHAFVFSGAQDYSQTLSVHLLAGHLPVAGEIPDVTTATPNTLVPALITQQLAHRLFPDRNALGSVLYDGNHSMRIVGIVGTLRGAITGRSSDNDSILIEQRYDVIEGGLYLIRSRSGQMAHVLPLAMKAMQKANPGNVVGQTSSLQAFITHAFAGSRAINRILMAITAILLIVTALGVSGLASFWVQQRTRQIGTRRALGATRGAILRHFQAENLIIVSMGVALGAALTIGLNVLLMQHFAQPRLPLQYVAFGALAMWALGQLAVLGPALRAARVPPTMAMRAA